MGSKYIRRQYTNEYVINGDVTTLIIARLNGEIVAQSIFDTELYPTISKYYWRMDYYGYVATTQIRVGRQVHLHRLVIDLPKGLETDHINRIRTDNRKANLRAVTHQANMNNQDANPVCINNIYYARFRFQKRKYNLGSYPTTEEAKAVITKAKEDLLNGKEPIQPPQHISRHSISGLRYAHYHKQTGKYECRLSIGGKRQYLGLFNTAKEASQRGFSAIAEYEAINVNYHDNR